MNKAEEQRFWCEVGKRLAPGEKLSKIKELYAKGILSYKDLINLPVLRSSEIRYNHRLELSRQDLERETQRRKLFLDVLKEAICIKGENGYSVFVSRPGFIVAIGLGNKIKAGFTSEGWSPRKEIEVIRSVDRCLYEQLKRSLDRYKLMFEEIDNDND